MEKRVAVLGPAGTNGDEAGKRFIPSLTNEQKVFCSSNEAIMAMVIGKEVDFGIVPIVNTSTGLIDGPKRVWMSQNDLFEDRGIYPIKELCLSIHHCLLVKDVDDKRPIAKVFSHTEALQQCGTAINAFGIKEKVAAFSTADAAKFVSEYKGEERLCAIASKFAAVAYGLQVLQEDVQDNQDNSTIFHMIGREPVPFTPNCKTAVIFWLKNETMSLIRPLNIISNAGKNMFMIDAIFSGNKNNIGFYVEFEGHKDEGVVEAILTLIAACTTKLVVLGSFPGISCS